MPMPARSIALPQSSPDSAFARWIAFGFAVSSALVAGVLVTRWIGGSQGLGSWRLPTLLLLVCAAVVLAGLGLVVAAPNPASLTVEGSGLWWQERSGRRWHIDWTSVPGTFSMGYVWYPFGSANGASPPVSYWLTQRRVRSILITREAFEAIRWGARSHGLLEVETHPVSKHPTASVVQIRFALGSSAR